jgi:hypothetical protein
VVVLFLISITEIFQMSKLSSATNERKSESDNVVVSLVALAINVILIVSILLSLIYLIFFHFRF